MRHALVGHMVTAMQRLGFSATASLEHRRLAVDLAEVALKWELQRIRDHSSQDNIVRAVRTQWGAGQRFCETNVVVAGVWTSQCTSTLILGYTVPSSLGPHAKHDAQDLILIAVLLGLRFRGFGARN